MNEISGSTQQQEHLSTDEVHASHSSRSNVSLLSQEDTVIIERQRLIENALRQHFGHFAHFNYLKDLMTYRYCRTCKQPKPPRTHHCSACKKCYMRMDHHCPWVGSCVAYRNHKLFLLFLLYTSLGCLYASLTMGLLTLEINRSSSSVDYFTFYNPATASR